MRAVPLGKNLCRILSSRKAESYLGVCVLILTFCLLFSLVFWQAGATGLLRREERLLGQKLDAYVARYAVEAYADLQDEADLDGRVDREAFEKGLWEALDLGEGQRTLSDGTGTLTLEKGEAVLTLGRGWQVRVTVKVRYIPVWDRNTGDERSMKWTFSSGFGLKAGDG